MTNDKSLYAQLCQKEQSIPLFLKYSWFNSIYDNDEWDVVVGKKGDEVVAFLPFVFSKNKSFKLITPQFLSPYQGVWINYPPDQKYMNRIGFEKEIITELIDRIPKVAAFKQNFLPGYTNWLPFFWKGFSQTTRYTYIINDISVPDKVFLGFKENIRREIRKAEKILKVSEFDDIELMHQMKVDSYKFNNKRYPVSKDKLKRVFSYCKENDCGELLTARDDKGTIHSILFYVWDNTTAYYLNGVTDMSFKTSGSMSLLLWEAIKRSSSRTKEFNFEGSMISSIERYFRAFGGVQTPYFQISKTNSRILKFLNY